MMRFITVCIVSVLMYGCGFGIGLTKGEDVSYTKPKFYLDRARGVVGGTSDVSLPWRYSKDEVLKLWGEPDKKEALENDAQTWVYYQSDLAWRGLVLGIGAPIPLFIATGHDRATLRFTGDTLTSAVSQEEKFHFCGYFIADDAAGWRCR